MQDFVNLKNLFFLLRLTLSLDATLFSNFDFVRIAAIFGPARKHVAQLPAGGGDLRTQNCGGISRPCCTRSAPLVGRYRVPATQLFSIPPAQPSPPPQEKLPKSDVATRGTSREVTSERSTESTLLQSRGPGGMTTLWFWGNSASCVNKVTYTSCQIGIPCKLKWDGLRGLELLLLRKQILYCSRTHDSI